MKLDAKIVSSLEKILPDTELSDYESFRGMSALLGEKISLQVIFKNAEGDTTRTLISPKLGGELAKYARVRRVQGVPVTMPVCGEGDEYYLSKKPGIYPDLLLPLSYGGSVRTNVGVLGNLWIDIDLPENGEELPDLPTLTVSLVDAYSDDELLFFDTFTLDLVKVSLPPRDIYYTRWLYTDCLASYYDVEVWSREHWRIIENYVRAAVKIGVNTILTPLITPSLDGERMLTQLVKIVKKGEKYSFNFSRVDKWIDMCDRAGIKYFEISHLFTQHGATNTPKISAIVDGEEKLIFTYANDGRDPEYIKMLRALLKAFVRHMKKRGDDKRCLYHISDEPPMKHIEYYRAAKNSISDILAGYKMIDALSDLEYYTEGLVECPVPETDFAEDFAKAGVKDFWVYYCGGPSDRNYSNSLIAMPSWRTRSIGMQMYKHNVEGFLHWGFNFYNNCNSERVLNPYTDLSGENWVAAGDTFIVYPDKNGEAIESLRAVVTYHAFEDIRAMKLCEKYYSHAEVVEAMENALGDKIAFDRSAFSADEMLKVREVVNAMIKAKASKM